MANIYGMVRLLPPSHPYLNAANIGKFGIRHVIAEAANNLVIDRRNIDQIVIFSALLIGTVLLFLQFGMLGYSLIVHQANAQMFGMFTTPAPRNDIAFLLLDRVFGVPGMFCSAGRCSAIQSQLPMPFHDALHALLQFYSIGMLCIGVLIFLYYITVVVVETAVTGSPFGQRFSDIWVPIRLVVALSLLVPVNWGLNSAQYITLFAAKMGSGFATNAWLAFNQTILDASANNHNGSNPLGEYETLIALGKDQDASTVLQPMTLVHSCAFAYMRINPKSGTPITSVLDKNFYIKPYLIKNNPISGTPNAQELTPGTTYQQALKFSGNGDIVIAFGEKDKKYNADIGNVSPICGQMRVSAAPGSDADADEDDLTGPAKLSAGYYNLIVNMWFNDPHLQQYAVRQVELSINTRDSKFLCGAGKGCGDDFLPACTQTKGVDPCENEPPTTAWHQNVTDEYQADIKAYLIQVWHDEAEAAPMMIDQDVLERGWAGAGIWYNKIAEMNGTFMGALLNLPVMEKYPLVMEKVRSERRKHDTNPNPIDQFSPNVAGQKAITLEGQGSDTEIARALNSVYVYWNQSEPNQANEDKAGTTNIFESAINMMFGVSGVLNIRNENSHIHPLAQLVAVGKGLVDGTLRNITISSISALGGGFLSASKKTEAAGTALKAISGFFMSASFVGLTAGLTLFYVLPFLPFMYFFFTVGTWIKTIFEAMVGVPLWALAHLRIDGNGLAGEAAQNGYFLIFEIFIRPILAVFGLIAGILIFSAQVRILNFIWDIVTSNVTGYDGDPNFTIIADIKMKRSIIDQFFFTVMYTIIVYMLAMSSFKLIDRIPDNITRWLGAGVSTFSDINEDRTEELKRYIAGGGLTFGQSITGGISSAAEGIGGSVGKLVASKPTGTGRPPGGAT